MSDECRCKECGWTGVSTERGFARMLICPKCSSLQLFRLSDGKGMCDVEFERRYGKPTGRKIVDVMLGGKQRSKANG